MPATQIIAQGQVQQVGQPVSVAGTAAHLVKTVSTPIPLQMPSSSSGASAVSINVTVPPQKANLGKFCQRHQYPPIVIRFPDTYPWLGVSPCHFVISIWASPPPPPQSDI